MSLILEDFFAVDLSYRSLLHPPFDHDPIDLSRMVVTVQYLRNGSTRQGRLPRLDSEQDCSSSEFGGWFLDSTGGEQYIGLCPVVPAGPTVITWHSANALP